MSLGMLLKIPNFILTRKRLINKGDEYWKKRMKGKCLQIDGRSLNPKAQALINLQSGFSAPVEKWTPGMIRGGYDKSMELFDGPKPAVSSVEDISLPLDGRTLKARFYGARSGDKKPALLYFHGGGFVIGGLESHDRLCRKLAIGTGQPVIAVDYRLGPENRFPAAFDDALDTWRWMQENADSLGIDPGKISVAGDSAGAVLALLISSVASKGSLGNLPESMGLIYPALWGEENTNSRKLLGKENIVLTKELLDWFADNFSTGDEHLRDDLMGALKTAVAGNMPPSWVLTCGFDPLRDEGESIAKSLADLGADVSHQEYEGMYHGFIGASAVLPEVDMMIKDLSEFLQKHQKQTAQIAAE